MLGAHALADGAGAVAPSAEPGRSFLCQAFGRSTMDGVMLIKRGFDALIGHLETIHAADIPVFDQYWRERPSEGPVRYLALGDSLAQGLGLAHPEQGYVAKLERRMQRVLGERVATLNVSSSGARTFEVIERQLQYVDEFAPHVITLEIGGNDVTEDQWEPREFAERVERILKALPAGTIVGDVPTMVAGTQEKRVRQANRIIREAIARRGHVRAPVYAESRKLVPFRMLGHMSHDFLHPNHRGHDKIADAFWPVVAAKAAELDAESLRADAAA